MLALFGATDGTAGADVSDREATLARIRRLENEVAALQARHDPWLSESRAREVRALVRDVLADADTRVGLLQNHAAAGWEKGFYLAGGDGRFRLNVKGYVQARYVANSQERSPSDDFRQGFENSRTQLFFEGHVIDPGWTYRIQGDFARASGSFKLLDAWVKRSLAPGWQIAAGQFRMPLLREFLVVETNQLAVDRSLVHQEFSGVRTQGVMLEWQAAHWRWSGSFDDGVPSSGGAPNKPWSAEDVEWSVSSRLESLLTGAWTQFADFTSFRGDDTGAMLGAAIHAEQGESGTANDELDLVTWTTDVSIHFDGASVFAAYVGRSIDGGGANRDQHAIVVQGGVFITDTLQPFSRLEWADGDDSSPDLLVATLGVNQFFARQRLKWTTDVGYGFHEVSSTWGNGFIGSGGDAVGWRADRPGEDGQIVLRSQVQLVF
jgi:hypothetical protein